MLFRSRRSSELGDSKWEDFTWEHPLDQILIYHDYDYICRVFGGSSKEGQGRGGKEDLDATQERGLRESEDRGRREQKRTDELSSYTWSSVHGMSYDELCALVEDKKLDVEPEKSKDDDDLADWICEEMKIKKETKQVSRAAPEKEESPRDRLRRLREESDR